MNTLVDASRLALLREQRDKTKERFDRKAREYDSHWRSIESARWVLRSLGETLAVAEAELRQAELDNPLEVTA